MAYIKHILQYTIQKSGLNTIWSCLPFAHAECTETSHERKATCYAADIQLLYEGTADNHMSQMAVKRLSESTNSYTEEVYITLTTGVLLYVEWNRSCDLWCTQIDTIVTTVLPS